MALACVCCARVSMDGQLVERGEVCGDDGALHPVVFLRQVCVQWLPRHIKHACEEGAPVPAVLAQHQAANHRRPPQLADCRETLSRIALGSRDLQYFRNAGGSQLLAHAESLCAQLRTEATGTPAAPVLQPATSSSAAYAAPPSPAVPSLAATHVLLNIEPRSSRHGYHCRDVCMAGGKRESGESRRQAAAAELQEEMGLRLRAGCELCCVRCGLPSCDGCEPDHWQPYQRAAKVYVFVVPAAHVQALAPPADADADADALADSMVRLSTSGGGQNAARANGASGSGSSGNSSGAYIPPHRRQDAAQHAQQRAAGTGAGSASRSIADISIGAARAPDRDS